MIFTLFCIQRIQNESILSQNEIQTFFFHIMNQKSDKNMEISMIEVNVSPLDQSGVTYKNDDNGSEIWNWCISNQFPISEIISKSENMVILSTGEPHQGYTIHTQMKDGKLHGDATIQSPENVIIAKFEYSEGGMTGPCKLYYPSGILFFEGYLENGYRHGRGREYNEQKKVIFDGFYEKGMKLKIYPFKELGEGYWKLMDYENQLRSVCQIDDQGKRYGICYFFEHGKISRVSEWQDGNEIDVLKEFTADNTMIEYENGVKVYEGGFLNSLDENYPRNGSGTEYDNDGKSAIYKGHFCNGKRHGLGISYRRGKISYNGKWIIGMPSCVFIIIYILLVLILASAFVLNMFYAMILLGILLFFIVLKRIFAKQTGNWLNSIDFTCLGEIIYTTQKNKGKKEGGCLSLAHHLYAIVLTLVVILFCFAAVYHFFFMPCDGYILQWSYYAGWNRCNSVKSFNPNMKSKLRSIRIGNDCFKSVETFIIDGYNRLKTINIGKNSFTQKKNGGGNDESKSFHILNCDSLESIEIGEFSFSDFAGEFELKNLSRLQSIQIGKFRYDSYNFYYSSFVIGGIELLLNIVMIRSSKSTIHYNW